MSSDKYFLYHQQGIVKVIAESDLPDKAKFEYELPYCKSLKKARSTKGIEVTNAFVAETFNRQGSFIAVEGPGAITPILEESHFYPIPEGWQVNIERLSKCSICGAHLNSPCKGNGESHSMSDCNCDLSIATLVPVEKPESAVEEDQEQLWLEAIQLVDGAELINSIDALKEKYHISRKS